MWRIEFLLVAMLFVALFTGSGLMVIVLVKAVRNGEVQRLWKDVRDE